MLKARAIGVRSNSEEKGATGQIGVVRHSRLPGRIGWGLDPAIVSSWAVDCDNPEESWVKTQRTHLVIKRRFPAPQGITGRP